MLVIQICLFYFSHGTVMRRARQETEALLKAGHRVIVITDLKWTSQIHYFKNSKNKPEIIILKPFYLPKPLKIVSSQLSFALKVYYALKKLSKKEFINLIVSHLSTACYAIAYFTKKKKIPTVWVIQDLIRDRIATGNPYNWIETQLLRHSNSYAIKNITYLIPVSKYSKKLLILDGAKPENTFIKYNAVDTLTFKPNPEIKKDIDVLFVGRLSIEKGVNILIEAARCLSKNRRIVIIGDGPLEKHLKHQAQHIKSDIKFLGFIKHELLPEFIQRAKILATPSLSECHAAVPLEAMACGVPVIASRVAGMEDTIEHNKSGWLLDQNTPQTLGKLIEKILRDNKLLGYVSQEALYRSTFFAEIKFNQDITHFYEVLIKKFYENNPKN